MIQGMSLADLGTNTAAASRLALQQTLFSSAGDRPTPRQGVIMTESPEESNIPTDEEHPASDGPAAEAEEALDLGDEENQPPP